MIGAMDPTSPLALVMGSSGVNDLKLGLFQGKKSRAPASKRSHFSRAVFLIINAFGTPDTSIFLMCSY